MRGRKRILVVDADENVLIRLERVLEDAGFETTTTWDPQEAMCFLHAVAFDLLLVGDHPPEVNARELLNAIGALRPTPCCIVLQSSGSKNNAEYIQLGAAAVTCRDRTEDVLRAVRSKSENWQWHEYDQQKVVCPKCGSDKVHQMAAAFTAVTSKKS